LELFLPKKDLLQQFSHRLPQGPFKLYRNSFKKEKKKITKDKIIQTMKTSLLPEACGGNGANVPTTIQQSQK
jgi:hypothetical protein